jgi:putative YhbY family RNA-binding protein
LSAALRAEAHGLKPIVLIGEAGLTANVLKEISLGLDSHGLIKVRVFGDDREARIAMYETICEQLKAAPVQHIGKLLVLYRPKVETEKARAPPAKACAKSPSSRPARPAPSVRRSPRYC